MWIYFSIGVRKMMKWILKKTKKKRNCVYLVFKVSPSLEKLEQLTQNGGSSFFAKKVWRGHQTLFLLLNKHFIIFLTN